MNKRAIVSLVLLCSLVTLPVSGLIVHAKHGAAASHTFLHLHALFGIIFLLAGIYHVFINWRILKNYLASRRK